MVPPTPETLRRDAYRCHELARALVDLADRTVLDDYADLLNQQADDLERTRDAQGRPARRVT